MGQLQIIKRSIYQGDRFLFGGTIGPDTSQGSPIQPITTVSVRAQIRPVKGEALIHDFAPVPVVENPTGFFTFTMSTNETNQWPVGKAFCDIEIDINSSGRLTITRLDIDIERSVTR